MVVVGIDENDGSLPGMTPTTLTAFARAAAGTLSRAASDDSSTSPGLVPDATATGTRWKKPLSPAGCTP